MQVLHDCADGQYELIESLWYVDSNTDHVSTRGQASHDLVARTQRILAARLVLAGLSPHEQHVLYCAVAPQARYGVPYDKLLATAKLPPEDFTRAINQLNYRLLLHQEDPARSTKKGSSASARGKVPIISSFAESHLTLYQAGRELFARSSDRTQKTLQEILALYNPTEIQPLVQRYRTNYSGYLSINESAQLVAEKLLNMGDPTENILDMDPKVQKLFRWLRQHNGHAAIKEAEAYLDVERAEFYRVVDLLEEFGIAFTGFTEQQLLLFIPHDLYANLNSQKNHQGRFKLTEIAATPTAIKAAEPITLFDLAFMTNLLYQQIVEPTQAGRLPRRISNKLRPQLRGTPHYTYEGTDEYPELLLLLMGFLDIAQLTKPPVPDAKACYTPTQGLMDWSKLSQQEQMWKLLQYWLKEPRWRDVAGANFQEPFISYIRPQPGREKIVLHLRRCQPNRWYSCESLLRSLWQDEPLALRQPSPYLRRTEMQALQKSAKDFANWSTIDGEVYIGMLTHTLYELGIIALGYRDPDALSPDTRINPDTFMLTQAGAAMFHQEDDRPATEDSERARVLIVQPSFELLLMQPDFTALYELLPFAQLEQIGMVSRLALTRNALLNGMKKGVKLDEVMRVLEKHSQKELPQNVVYTLNDWSKIYQEVTVSQVYLLEVSSDEAAQRLYKLGEFKKFHVRQLAPCILVVDSDMNTSTLKRLLDKEGISTQFSGNFNAKHATSNDYGRGYSYGYDYF
ncbi:MAG TPA: helicase-associated domain-containing protein [Ktedonobacteraceae bacterium]|nr:helicase-associated domain-containing protein [Ktedonobacteraceae bacterium]